MRQLVEESRSKDKSAQRHDQSDLDAWLSRVVGSKVSLTEMLEGHDAAQVQEKCRKMLKDDEKLSFVEHQLYKEALRLVTNGKG